MVMRETNNKTKIHQPVLLESVVKLLSPQPGESYLDMTAGYGGHASAIIKILGPKSEKVLVDRDEMAMGVLKEKFGKDQSVNLVRDSFADAAEKFVAEKQRFDVILADFGVSSPHLDIAERGFSFRLDGPLDMRMDQSQELSAEEIVNDYSQTDLVNILKQFGEEPKANQIAKAVVDNRPILSTQKLADVVLEVYGNRGKIHPATRTFQALRIAVNSELEQISRFLVNLPQLLKPGGRVACISFHRLEDMMVKKRFSSLAAIDDWVILTKKPIRGIDFDSNPRARSASLRAAVKQK